MNTNKVQDGISVAISELIATFGVKEPVDEKEILSFIHTGNTKQAIKLIAMNLGLPIEVQLSYASKTYSPSSGDRFNSSQLVPTDQDGHGIAGITAQVLIPAGLPLYGTSAMVNFPVQIRISENCADRPDTLVTVMAHELSHIVLHSMWHKEKENEVYTDLTAMTLGFARVMKKGRKVKMVSSVEHNRANRTTTTHTQTTTYGYLSDDEFEYATTRLEGILTKHLSMKRNLLDKIEQSKQQLAAARSTHAQFARCLSYLDKHLNRKIGPEEAQKISSYHQSGYCDDFMAIANQTEKQLDAFSRCLGDLRTYTNQSLEMVRKHENQLTKNLHELTRCHSVLEQDVGVLKKQVGFFERLRLSRLGPNS